MTKRDLVIQISEETGLVQQKVMDVVQRTLDLISESLADGKRSSCATLACSKSKFAKRASGAIPTDPEKDVHIPQKAVVKFKPGKEMREAVSKAPSVQA